MRSLSRETESMEDEQLRQYIELRTISGLSAVSVTCQRSSQHREPSCHRNPLTVKA